MATGQCLKCEKEIPKETNFRLCFNCAKENQSLSETEYTGNTATIGEGCKIKRKRETIEHGEASDVSSMG